MSKEEGFLMPRTKRTVVDGGVYHILNRGHNKDKIFCRAGDFERFKEIINGYKEKFDYELYHYCIMPNHFHLLMKIGKADELSPLMKGICQSYANYYRNTYEHVGYLFQNRYKSIFIEDDSYLLECARYIERNPVRANLADKVSGYPWSSYGHYAGRHRDDFITINPLFETLAGNEKGRREVYIDYMSKSRPYEYIVDERIRSFK